MRIAHTAARTLACASLSLPAIACAPREQPGPFTAVHLETSNERVVLERVNDHAAKCKGSCDARVPSGEYLITGPSVSPSEPFVVEGDSATYRVDVRRSNKSYRTGRALTIAGGGTMGAGVLFGILALATLNSTCSGWFCINPAPLFAVMSGVLGGTGLLILIPGVALMASSPARSEPTAVQRIAGLGLTGVF